MKARIISKTFLCMMFLFILSPAREWKKFETEHFIIHFHPGSEFTARKGATIAEEIYPAITGLYRYEPPTKTHLIFRDTEDYSNGGAYYFENKIEIWAEQMDFVLRGTHHWLRDVITHEFVHIISIQKALKLGKHIPGVYFQWFGYEKEKREDVVRGFPNVLVSMPYIALNYPVWFAEGVSQYQSNRKRFDYRDAQREMVLRDRVLNNQLLTLDEMSTFGKNSVGNESSYNQGFSLVSYLAERYGEEILRKIADEAGRITDLTFDQTIQRVLGRSLTQVYSDWKNDLEKKYRNQYALLEKTLTEGEILEEEGFGNFYPQFSPDGQRLAYVSNLDYPSFGNNVLIIATRKEGKWEKIIADRFITSSLTWSPDGKYLVYAKQMEHGGETPVFNDLYLYDTEEGKVYRITRNMRARNPDWNPVSNELVCVVSHDGSSNLVVLEIRPDLIKSSRFDEENRFGFHLTNHSVKPFQEIPADSLKEYHLFHIKSPRWRFLTNEYLGRQYYHPRWSPDGRMIIVDTSTEFSREIVRISPETGESVPLLQGKCDYRQPVWGDGGESIYFASDTTGIFNIYRLDTATSTIQALTSVLGGAFTPSVSVNGELAYSLYKNAGFRIALLTSPGSPAINQMIVIPEYHRTIPSITDQDSLYRPSVIKPSQPKSSNFLLFPRLLVDYGTIKPGFYFLVPEILNRLEIMGSLDINRDKDIFAYLNFTSRMFKKPVEFEVYNQISHISEQFRFPTDTTNADIRFHLMEINTTIHAGKLPWKSFSFLILADWQFQYTYNRYSAKIAPISLKRDIFGNRIVYPTFRYTYLKGHRLTLKTHLEKVYPTLERDINPQNGYYFGVEFTGQFQKFLSDFSTNRTVGLEEYRYYRFFQLLSELELYLRNPWWKTHTLDVKYQGGFIDSRVDNFFNFYAGGLIGLKGYPYYSIEGRKLGIFSAYYRFPLKRNMNRRLGIFYLKHAYLAPFFQIGNAWNGSYAKGFDNLKRDVGVQFRMNLFSFYFVPLNLFYELAYPLDNIVLPEKGITYRKEWRHYVGLLFQFDIRMTDFRRGL